MAKRLKDLTVNRVALVPAGANFDKKTGDGAHIVLFKAQDPIQKKIVQRDGEWCVTSGDGSQTLGCHDTRAAAVRQLAAVEANKHAEVVHELCLKAEDMAQTFSEIEENREVRDRINQTLWTLQDSVWSILNDPDADHMTMLQQTVAEFSAAVLQELPNLVTKAGRKISANRMKQLRSAVVALQAVLAEQEDDSMAEKTKKTAAPDREAVLKALPDEQREAVTQLLGDVEKANQEFLDKLEKATADLEAAQTKIAKLEKEEPKEPTEEDVLKSMPEAVRKRLETAETEAAEARKIAKEERDARQLQEFTKQAETDIPNLPSETAVKGRLLKSISQKLEKEDAEEVVRLLKAGSEAVLGMLKIQGHDDTPTGNSAIEKMEARAAEIKKAEPSLTAEQAFTRAVDENKELYSEYLQERQISA